MRVCVLQSPREGISPPAKCHLESARTRLLCNTLFSRFEKGGGGNRSQCTHKGEFRVRAAKPSLFSMGLGRDAAAAAEGEGGKMKARDFPQE